MRLLGIRVPNNLIILPNFKCLCNDYQLYVFNSNKIGGKIFINNDFTKGYI